MPSVKTRGRLQKHNAVAVIRPEESAVNGPMDRQ